MAIHYVKPDNRLNGENLGMKIHVFFGYRGKCEYYSVEVSDMVLGLPIHIQPRICPKYNTYIYICIFVKY